ncbi:Glycerol-3-phosphate dehydrogenase [Halomicronema hongdechloris C2206]|uniref:Glycerol-3-phosphate dehydrogenase n=1 Tax=Halomicronema hongdechloris C2206 TaxID=1641165 RepID=A0A1V8NED8_9CYAN|nr:glycerol-3-phosphate dehydrogenase/oxidase [Halomicronema hongdechloris]ASC73182.1 Glycerol-3-phosphate dehydrogenase [Halomicronema hongdechloris C2206]
MKRDLSELVGKTYDLLVIGGGIYGACVAWEASLRGLSVVLVEKGDFCSATSANSLKIIHGGLRYLQHGDFSRMRQSIKERQALLKIAPHLIHPLPVLVPTYGHGLKGREALTFALLVNDLVSYDRNHCLSDPQKHIPSGRTLSKDDVLKLVPGISDTNLTGGILFHDAQVYNSERLTLAFLHSATQIGAKIANYVEVTSFLQIRNQVSGVVAKDHLTGCKFDIQAKAVVNTSGPWVSQISNLLHKKTSSLTIPLAKAVNIVTRPLFKHPYAVGLSGHVAHQKTEPIESQGSRLFFIAPWRGKSMVGTAYFPYEDSPDSLAVTEQEVMEFIGDINRVYPAAKLQLEDVCFVHRGLLPCANVDPKAGNVKLTKRYQLYDHCQDGLAGLLSVVGVKYTTARNVAHKVVDWVMQICSQEPSQSASSLTPLHGGEIENFNEFLRTAQKEYASILSGKAIQDLVYNYGSSYSKVLEYLDDSAAVSKSIGDELPIDSFAVLKAETRYAVNEEMAQKLTDLILRRTSLGSAERPTNQEMQICADVMGKELGWGLKKVQEELQAAIDFFDTNFSSCKSSL